MQAKKMKLLVPVLAACALLSAGTVRAAGLANGAPVDGIKCDAMEGAVMHIHQHLAIRDHGKAVTVPDDVGRPLAAQCLYWIHTHTPDGIVHIESPGFRTFTLGEFFDAEYGSATFAPMAEPGELELKVSTTGLLLRPLPAPVVVPKS